MASVNPKDVLFNFVGPCLKSAMKDPRSPGVVVEALRNCSKAAADAAGNIPKELKILLPGLEVCIFKNYLVTILTSKVCLNFHTGDWSVAHLLKTFDYCLSAALPNIAGIVPDSECNPDGDGNACGDGGKCVGATHTFCPPYLSCIEVPIPGVHRCRRKETVLVPSTTAGPSCKAI